MLRLRRRALLLPPRLSQRIHHASGHHHHRTAALCSEVTVSKVRLGPKHGEGEEQTAGEQNADQGAYSAVQAAGTGALHVATGWSKVSPGGQAQRVHLRPVQHRWRRCSPCPLHPLRVCRRNKRGSAPMRILLYSLQALEQGRGRRSVENPLTMAMSSSRSLRSSTDCMLGPVSVVCLKAAEMAA